jgi:hypothetical protein
MADNRQRTRHRDRSRPASGQHTEATDQRGLRAIRAGLGHTLHRATPITLARLPSLEKRDQKKDG